MLNKCPASRKHSLKAKRAKPFPADLQRHFPTGKENFQIFYHLVYFLWFFSALNDSTNIFRFGGKIKVTIKWWIKATRKWGLVIVTLQPDSITEKFSILRRDKSPPSQTLKSENLVRP